MAAAMPYSDDPLPRFRAWCFGFLCEKSSGGKFIQQVKPRKSSQLSNVWEQVQIDEEDPNNFVIEPHMVTGGKQLGMKSLDTFHPTWPMDYAVSMDPVKFNLTGHVQPGQKVGVKFTVKESTEFVLEVDCRDGEVKKKILELCGDRERVYFVERLDDQQDGMESDKDLDPPQTDRSDAGRIETQLEQAGQNCDVQQQTDRLDPEVGQNVTRPELADQNPVQAPAQQQPNELDALTSADDASTEQADDRSTPKLADQPDTYHVPETPPHRSSPRKRRRTASENAPENAPERSSFFKRILSS